LSPQPGSTFDAVVVGAGTSGSACALGLARHGLKVALVERRPLFRAGARWINLVPRWLIERAGWWPLEKDELGAPPAVFHIAGPAGRPRVSLTGVDLYPLRVGVFLARLHRLCRQAGVEIFERSAAGRLEFSAGRPCALRISNPSRLLRAGLFVEASGIRRALAAQLPALGKPGWEDQQLCCASQWRYRVRDKKGALAFCRYNDIRPGETLARNGISGAFSTLSVHVDPELEVVDALTGCLGRSGSEKLVGEFAAANRWLGKRLFGGGGLIPLMPRRALFSPGLAVLGDAAGQVFAAHASGTGAGLVAASFLVEACAGASDPGAAEVLDGYARRWRDFSGVGFSMAAAFSRALAGGSGELVEETLELLSACPGILRGGLEQRLRPPDIYGLGGLIMKLTRRPRFLLRLIGPAAEAALFLARLRLEPQ